MKHKICAVLLSVSLFFVSLDSCPGAVTSYAAGAAVVEFIDTAGDVLDFLQWLSETLEKYFGYDVTTFKGMSKYEVRSRLISEFNPFASDITTGFTRDQLYIFVTSWSIQDFDTITSEFGADVSSYCNTNASDFYDYYKMVMYYFDSPADFVDALYSSNLNDYNVDDKGNVQVPIEDFKEELEKENNTISPKNREMLKYSWRDLSPDQENPHMNAFARGIFKEGESCVGTSLEEGIYVQLYMRRNGAMYYTPYQYKLYCKKESQGGHSPIYKYDWYMCPIYYERVDGVSLDTFEINVFSYADSVSSSGSITGYDAPYFSLGLSESTNTFTLTGYKSLGGCLNNLSNDRVSFPSHSNPLTVSLPTPDYSSMYKEYFKYFLRSDDVADKYGFDSLKVTNADGTTETRYGLTHFFHQKDYSGCQFPNTSIDTHDTGVLYGSPSTLIVTCDEGNTCDFGFLVSSEQFTTTYQFDTARLPSNATVTISGDSVYDYSITDNSSGESSTIYNYVTNNYSYPEISDGNTSGGSGGNGGTIGGDITVGGQVDVGGKVDINVNVNGNNGGDGNINDWIDVNSSDVDSNVADYIGLVPKLSKNFIDYMKDFFSWLPKEVYGLVVAGLVFLVVCLVFRRL